MSTISTTHGRSGVLLLCAVVTLTACGSGDGASDDASASVDTASAVTDDQEEKTDDQQQDAEEEPAPASDELEAADGWNGPPDVEGPAEPGTGVLRIEGQDIELELRCERPGVVGHESYLLFDFQAVGQGQTDDGRTVTATAGRQIVDTEEAAKSVYDYKGQESGMLQVSVEAEEGWHSSIVVTPGDDDPTASQLPVVRVTEDGAFSAIHDLEPLAAIHETALAGPAELAGQCQDGWDEEQG